MLYGEDSSIFVREVRECVLEGKSGKFNKNISLENYYAFKVEFRKRFGETENWGKSSDFESTKI